MYHYIYHIIRSLSVFSEVGVTDLRSDVEIGRLDLQLGGLIDCCSFRARSEYQVSFQDVCTPLFFVRAYAVETPARVILILLTARHDTQCTVPLSEVFGWLGRDFLPSTVDVLFLPSKVRGKACMSIMSATDPTPNDTVST